MAEIGYKRLIYKLGAGEAAPQGSKSYILPVNGAVVDVVVEESFTTSGVILYDSLNGVMLDEPPVHHFLGWEF